MPVGPIGNMNFINQNVTYQSTQVSNEAAKEGFANFMNMVEANEKEKVVAKLEKVNQSPELQEQIKEKSEEERGRERERRAKKEQEDQEKPLEQENEEEGIKEGPDDIHHLDMSV